jgi:hypothetical protein
MVTLSYLASAQKIICNKLSVQLAYGMATPIGSETLHRQNYSAPSFTNNFQSATIFSIAAQQKVRHKVIFHLGASFVSMTDWKSPGVAQEDRYNGAHHTMFSINPGIGIQTPYRRNGFWNSFTLGGVIGPMIGFGKVTFGEPVFSSPDMSNDFGQTKYISPGLALQANAIWHLSNRVGLGCVVQTQYYSVSSVLLEDTSMFLFNFQGSVIVKLLRNRRFLYSGE